MNAPAIELTERLVGIADALAEHGTLQISDEAIRVLRDEIRRQRLQLSETAFLIGYEATCLIECMAEVAYARTDGDRSREQRALMYINSLRVFMRRDVVAAQRRPVTS